MTTIDTAKAFYEDTIESAGETSAEDLARKLRERAESLRLQEQEISNETREDLEIVLEDGLEPEDVADELEQASDDMQSTFSGKDVTLKELEPGVAGQAQLGEKRIWVNPKSITGEEEVIDQVIAKDIAVHEEEHTKQSAVADADGILVKDEEFDAREIREAAAISTQSRRDFLSKEYQEIARSLPMDNEDRILVRQGRFRALQAKKNGQRDYAQAA